MKEQQPTVIGAKNVHEVIDQAIDKYFKKGMIVDALFWSKCMGIIRDELKKAKGK